MTPAPRKKPARLYAYADIVAETGLPAPLLRVWYQRGKLPEADYRVGQSPAWLPETIRPWIRKNKPKETPNA